MESSVPNIEIRLLNQEDLMMVKDLAWQIFPDTYKEIVDAAQISYMMDLFYTPEALLAQWKSGQVFLVIFYEEKPSGYASFTRLSEAGDFKLNKIYVDGRLQGKGLGRALIQDVISRVRSAGGKLLQLHVNRLNKAVDFYRALGFTLKKEVSTDIGNGFFMDDYLMELAL